MQPNDAVASIQGELAGLRNKARLGPLVRLGQALMERYWRAGPGTTTALPYLNQAITAFAEAWDLLDPADPLRGQVAGLYGWVLAARSATHLSPAHLSVDVTDRERGIEMLELASESTTLPPPLATTVRMLLGQLYFARAATSLGTAEVGLAAVIGGANPATIRDIDRSISEFHSIIEGPPISDQIIDAATAMLELAEALRLMFGGLGGGVAGLDFGQMMQAMGKLQRFQAEGLRRQAQGGSASAGPLPYFGLEQLVQLGPLHYPVALIRDAESPAAAPVQPLARPEPTPFDPAAIRLRLHSGLSIDGATVPAWSAAAELLTPTGPRPSGEAVDELVALASLVAEQPAADAITAGVDQLVLAAALFLRGARDPADAGPDRAAGARALLRAAESIPPSHPATASLLGRLGAFLNGWRPNDGTLEPIADAFADRIDAAISSGAVTAGADLATLHALRCLCRAVTAGDGRADLARAVGTVPLEYPWLAQLTSAATTLTSMSRPDSQARFPDAVL